MQSYREDMVKSVWSYLFSADKPRVIWEQEGHLPWQLVFIQLNDNGPDQIWYYIHMCIE